MSLKNGQSSPGAGLLSIRPHDGTLCFDGIFCRTMDPGNLALVLPSSRDFGAAKMGEQKRHEVCASKTYMAKQIVDNLQFNIVVVI